METHQTNATPSSTKVPGGPRRILILAFDGVTLVDLAGPADVFDIATRYILDDSANGYDVSVACLGGGRVTASNGMSFDACNLDDLSGAFHTLIVPGGGPPKDPPTPADLVDWMRRNAPRFERICAVCTGTFLLGEAGLIDNRRVTTHWEAADVLRDRYPEAIVDSASLYMQDDPIWTSAGFSAGSDMAVALIQEDFGHHIAIEVSRRLVIFLKRTGEQRQISTTLSFQASSDETFSRLHAWIMANLNADLSVSRLAEFVHMSPRTFARTYSERLGRTPAKTVETMRLEAAFRLVVTTNLPLKRIAVETGFGDEQNLRRNFLKSYDQTPMDIQTAHREGDEVEPVPGRADTRAGTGSS